MRCCRICAIDHESLEVGAVMMMLTRLSDGDAIESDVTLTEYGVEEIIRHARVVRKLDNLYRGRYQFTPDRV